MIVHRSTPLRNVHGLAPTGAALSAFEPGLCLETQSRQLMAILVNDVVAEALRLGLHDKPAEQVIDRECNSSSAAMGRIT